MTVSREIACEDETIFLVKSQTESIEKHNVENEARDLKLEVEELKDLISKYEITFERLVKCSPKHKKNRKKCLDIADYICSTQDLHKEVVDKGVLAAKKIGAETGVSTKLIEKYRIYIITQVLIETYDLPMIREFMKG